MLSDYEQRFFSCARGWEEGMDRGAQGGMGAGPQGRVVNDIVCASQGVTRPVNDTFSQACTSK